MFVVEYFAAENSFPDTDIDKSDFKSFTKNSLNFFHLKRVKLILAWPNLKMFKLQIDALQLNFSSVRSVIVPLRQCDLRIVTLGLIKLN